MKLSWPFSSACFPQSHVLQQAYPWPHHQTIKLNMVAYLFFSSFSVDCCCESSQVVDWHAPSHVRWTLSIRASQRGMAWICDSSMLHSKLQSSPRLLSSYACGFWKRVWRACEYVEWDWGDSLANPLASRNIFTSPRVPPQLKFMDMICREFMPQFSSQEALFINPNLTCFIRLIRMKYSQAFGNFLNC